MFREVLHTSSDLSVFQDGALIVAADVVDLADAALLQDEVDGAAVILDIEPVTDVLAVAPYV